MMEDPGAELSTEEASSMALAAAEAAAAAEEQELAAAAGGGGDHLNDLNHSNNGHHHLDDDPNHDEFAPHDVGVGVNSGNIPGGVPSEDDANNRGSPDIAPPGNNASDMNNSTNNDGDDRSKCCRICGKGPDDDGRVLCRFLPAQVDSNTSAIAPQVVTFEQDIALHVFCGKTASILPNVNQPDLEILSKAGIKNKHGIGPEVNGALARTRSSTVAAEGAKEKTFYIVKEFEAHLAAIRSASMGVAAAAAAAMDPRLQQHHHQPPPQQHHHHHPSHHPAAAHPYHHAVGAPLVDPNVGPPVDPSFDPLYHTGSMVPQHSLGGMKVMPHKAGHSYQKPAHGGGRAPSDPWIDVTITPDGKIRCGCGGTHLPTGTAKGDASWRSHVMTKRHQKWMEENGLLGAV
jgi:hypothetical protein